MELDTEMYPSYTGRREKEEERRMEDKILEGEKIESEERSARVL